MVAYGRLKTKENCKLSSLKVVAVAYERWSLTRGSNYSDLTEKFLVFWKSGGEVQLFFCFCFLFFVFFFFSFVTIVLYWFRERRRKLPVLAGTNYSGVTITGSSITCSNTNNLKQKRINLKIEHNEAKKKKRNT